MQPQRRLSYSATARSGVGPRISGSLSPALRGPDLGEEAGDLSGKLSRLRRQLFRGAQHLVGGGAGAVGGALHTGNVRGDLLGAARGLLDVARNFLGRGPLFLDRRGDRNADLIDLGDDVDHIADRRHRLVARRLNSRDMFRYFG